ncbi:MAG: histidine kinase [Bacteroidota bacterium]
MTVLSGKRIVFERINQAKSQKGRFTFSLDLRIIGTESTILMRIIVIICVLSCLLPRLSFSQEEKKDKKVFPSTGKVEKLPSRGKKLRKNARSDTQIFDRIESAQKIAEKDPEKALSKIEEALTYSYKSGSLNGEAHSYYTLGLINYQLGRYETATENHQKALELFKKLGDKEGQYNSLKYLGLSQDGMGQQELALENLQRFKSQAKGKNKSSDLIEAENRISRIQYGNQAYDASLNSLENAIAEQGKLNDSIGIARNYLFMGQVNQQIGNQDKAVNYYEDAGELASRLGDTVLAANSFDYLSDLYRSQEDLGNELQVQQQALVFNRNAGDVSREGKVSKRIGEIYVEQNQIEEAIPYFQNSVDKASEVGELRTQQEAQQALASAFEKTGKIDEAIDNYRSAIALSDKIQEMELEAIADSITFEKQLTQRDQKIAMLRKDQELSESKRREQENKIAQQNFMLYALLAGLLLVLISGFFILRSYRARRKANQLLMLKSLRSQMNPHFIFNSLNSINSFIAKQDERSANKYLSSFSRLMRTVLENSQQDFVPLITEIEVLERYLSLEHFRFQDKFEYEFIVDESVNRDQIDIPPMLIQPYVENAVWHGLRYKEAKGFLKLHMKQEDEQLIIHIEDNGIGRERSQALKTKHQKAQKSTGLKNTEERLKIINELYKKEVQVKILDLDTDAEDIGTRVEIKLPIH